MCTNSYCYTFSPEIPFEEVEGTMLLAIFGAESLLGETEVRLDSDHTVDRDKRTCTICADTRVGRAVNRLFAGFFSREFGNGAFQIKRTAVLPQRAGASAA